MTFHAYGDRAILINFEQIIDPDVNASVIALSQSIESADIPGINFCIPAYCSLTVGYEPSVLTYEQLCGRINGLVMAQKEKPTGVNSRTLRIPVCYEEGYALDFENVILQTKLSREKIIELHTATLFRVYMLGFLPGFVYLGKLPSALICKRKTTPLLRVPARAVGLAGLQTGIYPSQAPGGWQIIGRTPIPLFDGQKEDPFLCKAGDQVRFYVISGSTYQQIEEEIISGNYSWEKIYE